jgi:hypothetical protein
LTNDDSEERVVTVVAKERMPLEKELSEAPRSSAVKLVAAAILYI